MTLAPITMARRLAHVTIDTGVFAAVYVVVTSLTVPPPFDLMQSYSREDYDAYVRVAGLMTLALFALSIAMHALFGGSIGKLVAGTRTVRLDGRPVGFTRAAMRAAVFFGLGLMILAPGPLIAVVFGSGSEAASLVALVLGLAIWLIGTFPLPPGTSPSLVEAKLGLVSVVAPGRDGPA